MADEHNEHLTRRGLLAGLGALGGGAVLGATAGSGTASAEPEPSPLTDGSPRFVVSDVTPLGSPPQGGVTYTYANFHDFVAESGTRLIGGYGAYGDLLWATLALPAGAIVRDVEWYTINQSGAGRSAYIRLWAAGISGVGQILNMTIPQSAAMTATYRSLPTTLNGPFPLGTKLMVGVHVPTSAAQVHGIRVGYSPGPLRPTLLPTPIRVYDSRSVNGPIAPNGTRNISLAAAIPVGAVGALINLSVTNTNGSGTLRVGKGGDTPVATSLQWSRTGDRVTTSTTTQVSGNREIAVLSVSSTGTTQLLVDVVGYLV